jgi:glycerol-3-phosphate acyltransferase PlsY
VTAFLAAVLIWILAYLIGAVPFGYLCGRAKGVDLFTAGSGNIGATNVGRVLGRKYGIFVFVLDFLKGAIPTLLAAPLAKLIHPDGDVPFGVPHLTAVGAAAVAFLGHLFPVYLGFRGGKGVATGAGAVLAVAPVPTLLAVVIWIAVALASRTISLASLAAVGVLCLMQLLTPNGAFSLESIAVTIFCLVGSLLVVVKHRGNVSRILSGTESQFGDSAMQRSALAGVHLLALGLWFGGAAFFNFAAAPAIFVSFEKVVNDSPSDRTAGIDIVPVNADAETKKKLSSALAGAAVGPIFPKYFLMMTVCGVVAVATAFAWWKLGGVHRIRFVLLLAAFGLVLVGWPISDWVTQLRLERLSPDVAIANEAKSNFKVAHFISLGISLLTNLLTGIALFLAGCLPKTAPCQSCGQTS